MPNASEKKGAYNILVVDDHRFIHDVISKILSTVKDMTITGHAANGLEAIQLCRNAQPDIILMDIMMPVMDGLEAVRTIHVKYPQIKILVLSSYQDHESVHLMLKNGAVGYVTKSELTAELINVIRTVISGKNVFSPEVMEFLRHSSPNPGIVNKFNLTDREIEVLLLLAEGLQNQQISDRLEISVSTVKYHKNNIFEKLNVQTQSEALVIAVKNNLI
ncbi:MAG: response regulator transcription factor [Anaerolineales bacterium]|nr:response regulator transcription factor [candidate division KSB1 bacterium]MCB0103435.1 response regulator transcription factor [Anaerolineales bacterium]MCB9146074.1 response regulator transcription factor [Anaerolineales bacterium]